MKKPSLRACVWSCFAACIAVGLWSVFDSGSVVKDTPFTREFAAVHQLSAKLALYAQDHATFPAGQSGESISALVEAGALSTSDAEFIRQHRIEFRGFDPGHIGSDVVVFETTFTNTKPARKIIGYSDGHAQSMTIKRSL